MQIFLAIVLLAAAAWRRRGHGQVAHLAVRAGGGLAVPVAALAGIVAAAGAAAMLARACAGVLGAAHAHGAAGLVLLAAAVVKAVEPPARPVREPTRSLGAIALAQALLFVASPVGMALAGLALVDRTAVVAAMLAEAVFVARAWTRPRREPAPTPGSRIAGTTVLLAGAAACLVW